jgi:hypothetical protein
MPMKRHVFFLLAILSTAPTRTAVTEGQAGYAAEASIPSVSDHRSPFGERWGGWYVTGKNNSVLHLGNRTATNVDNFESVAARATRTFESLQGRLDLC